MIINITLLYIFQKIVENILDKKLLIIKITRYFTAIGTLIQD
jgi:hypothetical protein